MINRNLHRQSRRNEQWYDVPGTFCVELGYDAASMTWFRVDCDADLDQDLAIRLLMAYPLTGPQTATDLMRNGMAVDFTFLSSGSRVGKTYDSPAEGSEERLLHSVSIDGQPLCLRRFAGDTLREDLEEYFRAEMDDADLDHYDGYDEG